MDGRLATEMICSVPLWRSWPETSAGRGSPAKLDAGMRPEAVVKAANGAALKWQLIQ